MVNTKTIPIVAVDQRDANIRFININKPTLNGITMLQINKPISDAEMKIHYSELQWKHMQSFNILLTEPCQMFKFCACSESTILGFVKFYEK